MIDLILVLFFGLLISSPVWMTCAAGRFSGMFSKPKAKTASELVFIVAVVSLLFVVIAGFAWVSSV
ncbi:hypothetical protein AB0D11_48660 [Streptomyces monashensis]|uniref:hypothetical protein n=1 Tax=Streptomyces monashensis TaxID=1678012 RepID=UPI0033D9A9B9